MIPDEAPSGSPPDDALDEVDFIAWIRRRKKRTLVFDALTVGFFITAVFFIGVAVGKTGSTSLPMTSCDGTGTACPIVNQAPVQQAPRSGPLQRHQQAVAACEAQAAANNGGQPLLESQITACASIP